MQYVLKKIRILGLAFLLAARTGQAQTSDCFWLKMPVVAAQQGDTVCLPVLAYGFSEIIALQFELSWDTAALDFVRIDIAGSQLAPISQGFNFGANSAGTGRIQFLWYKGPGESLSLPDGAFLFSVCLKAKTSQAVYTPVALGSGPAFFYEAFNVSGTLLNRAVQEGGVRTGGLPGGNAPRFDQVCVNTAECGQSSGAITALVSGGVLPYTYQWTGPSGFVSNDTVLNYLAGGDYGLTVTDAAGGVLYGSFSVNATHSPVQVKTGVEAAFCGLPNGCARLTVSGGAPPYTYHWPDGVPAGPERCDLLPGSFLITVTDANGCARQRQVDILNDTLLQVEHSVQHIQTCNGRGGAAFAVSGGLPPYQFNWSTGDTSALVSGLTAGGQGPIGRIWFSPKSPENNEPPTPLQFYLTHAAAITPSEILIPLNGPAATVPLKPGQVSHAGTAPALNGRVSVWPNPVQETFRIVSDLTVETVEMIDAAGRIKSATTGNAPIHVHHLPQGLYMLRITTSGGIACKRIIVIR